MAFQHMLHTQSHHSQAAAWCSGNVILHINKVTLHRARLVLVWGTIFGQHTTLVPASSRLGQLSLLPSVGWEKSIDISLVAGE